MCTVTFLPTGGAAPGYLLATNRDESPVRAPATPPERATVGGRTVLLPRDAEAGGTWIAVDDAGRTVCLLNGDRPPAGAGAPPPRGEVPSRGLLVLELMEDPRPDAVAARLRERIERDALPYRPFKLLVADPAAEHVLHVDWDAVEWREERRAGPSILVSSTHRREEVAAFRAAAFEALLADRGPAGLTAGHLAAFHAGHGDRPAGDAFTVCMHRDDARTVSSTLVRVDGDAVVMDYRDGWPCQAGDPVSARLDRRGG